MTRLSLILATVACLLLSALLAAQEVPQTGLPPSFSAPLSQNPVYAATAVAASQTPPKQFHGAYFFSSARRHPMTPRDISMREAVEALGTDKHRFVGCALRDGSHFVGGITQIGFESFTISNGIMGGRLIKYSDLQNPPEHVPAVGEHVVNGLKWTGVVAACVALSPIAIALFPLIITGVITD